MLLVDRALLSDAPAVASAAPSVAGSISLQIAEAALGPMVSVEAAPFPSVDREFAAGDEVRDVFLLTPTLRAALLDGDETAYMRGGRPGRTSARRTTSEAFKNEHQLKAVMLGEHVSFAIVDDAWLQPGDRIGSCTLESLTGTTAAFRCSDAEVLLSVVDAIGPNSTHAK